MNIKWETLKTFNHHRLKLLLCGCALMVTVCVAKAAPILDVSNPLGFFTNTATRLLATELHLNLTQIQIYPTNQYTPAVHRLLQVAANVYDATTNNSAVFGKDYPSVFRPVFTQDGYGNVFISGYTNVMSVSDASDPVFSTPVDASALTNLEANIPLNVNVYGVPWVIGVKKGFPNFNEFSLESVVTVTRKLLLTRTNNPVNPGIGGLPMILLATNQMYIFSVTNYLGVEFWNSYSNAYTNATIVVRDNISMTLTNPLLNTSSANFIWAITNVAVWPGAWTNGNLAATSFVLPMGVGGTNLVFLPPSVYQFGVPGFVDLNLNPAFENAPAINLPQFGLLVSNRLQVFMLDNSHVIDYAQFSGPDSSRNLNTELVDPNTAGNPAYQWSTNLYQNSVPWGVLNQIAVSSGVANLVSPQNGGSWANPPGLPVELRGNTGAIQVYFHGFLSPNSLYSFNGKIYTNTDYAEQAPYTPTRTLVNYTSWQANDPLVHYLASDLNYSGNEFAFGVPLATGLNQFNPTLPPVLPGLGFLNDRYQPWGILRLAAGLDSNPYNSAYKDPLVTQSDHWNFPIGNGLPLTTLGQVHRGTPWQTIYLKSANILATSGIATWTNWTGDAHLLDATNTAPVQDWQLASQLMALFNTNQLTALVSVNDPDPAAWQGLLDGLTAFTNISEALNSVLISSNSVQAMIIAEAIQSARIIQPGQIFSTVGDILSAPQLAEQSPFLTGLNTTNGITDEAYEIIPSQLLPMLRADSIGSTALINNQPLVQFSGYDGHAYAIQTSSDLIHWTSISTNCPVNGVFSLTNSAMATDNQQFYRSVLLQ